jgi:hypothetical protein
MALVAFDAIRDVPERPSTCPQDLSPRLELRCLLGLNTGIGDHGAPPSEEGAPRLVRGGRSSAPKEPNGEHHSEAVTAPIVRGCGVPGGPWPRLPSPRPRRGRLRWRFRLVRANAQITRKATRIAAIIPLAAQSRSRHEPGDRRGCGGGRQCLVNTRIRGVTRHHGGKPPCDRVALLIREEEIGDRCHECHLRDEREEHPVRDGGRELQTAHSLNRNLVSSRRPLNGRRRWPSPASQRRRSDHEGPALLVEIAGDVGGDGIRQLYEQSGVAQPDALGPRHDEGDRLKGNEDDPSPKPSDPYRRVGGVGWALAPENRRDKPEPAHVRVDSITLAVREPIVAVERLIASAIPERFEHVLHARTYGYTTGHARGDPTITHVISIGTGASVETVNSRADAVARAETLGLLDTAESPM